MEELNKIEDTFSQDNMKQIIKCLTVYFCKYLFLQNKNAEIHYLLYI